MKFSLSTITFHLLSIDPHPLEALEELSAFIFPFTLSGVLKKEKSALQQLKIVFIHNM